MLRSEARLRILRRLLRSDEDLQAHCDRVALFYEHEGDWHSNRLRIVTLPSWRRHFARALSSPKPISVGTTLVKGFPELSVVVAVRLRTLDTTSSETIDRTLRRVRELAELQFTAEFDKLTNAPNRRLIERHLDALAQTVAEFSSASVPSEQAIIMMVDLDNFKQANDTVGHHFGDALLQVTAWRLRRFAAQLVSSGRARDVIAGRWGGEEFLLAGLVSSKASDVQLIALELVRFFASPPMPDTSSSEVRDLQELSSDNNASFSPPTPPVTASVGWAWLARAKDASELRDVVSDCVSRADTAMYRAKTIGKNTAVAFDDIHALYGRVLAHRADAGIVVLDIGKSVGVNQGDVFEIVPDDFAMRKAFVFRDGRTERTLGPYPPLAVAKVKVEVATDATISFCSILEIRKGLTQISEKAHATLLVPAPPPPDPTTRDSASVVANDVGLFGPSSSPPK